MLLVPFAFAGGSESEELAKAEQLAKEGQTVEAAKLYASFEELMMAEDWGRDLPSNVVLISGPSKTADIEQTLAYGVHGPTELIVMLLR